MGWLISLVVTLVVAALVIWVVGRLNLGMTVSGFGAAFIAAIVIAVVAWVVYWLLGLLGLVPTDATWLGWILTLIIAAVVLMFSDRFVPGMTGQWLYGCAGSSDRYRRCRLDYLLDA